MKRFILIVLTFILFGCFEEPKEVYETEIKTYTISHKEVVRVGGKFPHDIYHIYFQTPVSTERVGTSFNTYNKYQEGDTIQVLIKYWEKPKKK